MEMPQTPVARLNIFVDPHPDTGDLAICADIPNAPRRVYRGDWTGWGDWLGTGQRPSAD
jgi:hypothetical protein